MAKFPEGVAGTKGHKMIELRVRFWTDGLAPKEGDILPKHGWVAGVVCMDSNPLHGIRPQPPTPFNTLLELPGVIEKVLTSHGVRLRPYGRMKKYIATP